MPVHFTEPNYYQRSQRQKELIQSAARSYAARKSYVSRSKRKTGTEPAQLSRRNSATPEAESDRQSLVEAINPERRSLTASDADGTWRSMRLKRPRADDESASTTSSENSQEDEDGAVPLPPGIYELALGSTSIGTFGMQGLEYIELQGSPRQIRMKNLFRNYYASGYLPTFVCHPTNVGEDSRALCMSDHIRCCLRSPIAMEAYTMLSQHQTETQAGKFQGVSVLHMDHQRRLWAMMRESLQNSQFDEGLFFGFLTSLGCANRLGDWQTVQVHYQGLQAVLKSIGRFSSFSTSWYIEAGHAAAKLTNDCMGLSTEDRDMPPVISTPSTSRYYQSSRDLPIGLEKIHDDGQMSTVILRYLLQVQAWIAVYKRQNYRTRHFLGKLTIATHSAYYLKHSAELSVYEKLILTAIVSCLRALDGGFAVYLVTIAHLCMDPYFDALPTLCAELAAVPSADCLLIWVALVVVASKKNALEASNYGSPEWTTLINLAGREPWLKTTWQRLRPEMQLFFYNAALDEEWGQIWTVARTRAALKDPNTNEHDTRGHILFELE